MHAPRMNSLSNYRAPRWLPGGNAQTLWSAVLARRHQGPRPQWRRERWTTPDGDFIDVDFARHELPPQAPLLVLFHGLEGSSASQYAVAFADFAARQGLAMAVPHFRGCSGEMNLAPRAYHSGDYEEIDWILQRFASEWPGRRLMAVGVSLGGNALMRWAGEAGEAAARLVEAIASVCAPLDLAAGGRAIGRCMASVTRMTTGRGLRQSRTCTASGCPRWCSTRATTRSCPRPRCRRHTRWASG